MSGINWLEEIRKPSTERPGIDWVAETFQTPNWVLRDQSYRDRMPQPPVEEVQRPTPEPMWTRSSERPDYYEKLAPPPRDTLPGNRTPANPPSVDLADEVKLGTKKTDKGKINFLRERFGDDNVFVSKYGKLHVRPDGKDWVEVTPSSLPAIMKAAVVIGATAALSPAAVASPLIAGAFGVGTELAEQGVSAALPGDDEMSWKERVWEATKAGALNAGAQGVANTIAKGGHYFRPRNIIGREVLKEVSTPAEGEYVKRFLKGDLSPNVGPLTPEAQAGIDLAKESGVPLSVGRATGSDTALQVEGWLRRGHGGETLRAGDEAQQVALATKKADAMSAISPKAITPEEAGSTVKSTLDVAAPLSETNRAARQAANKARLAELRTGHDQLLDAVGGGQEKLPAADVGRIGARDYRAGSDKLYREATAEARKAFAVSEELLIGADLSASHTYGAVANVFQQFDDEGVAYAKKILGARRFKEMQAAQDAGHAPGMRPKDLEIMLTRASRTLRGEGFTSGELTEPAQKYIASQIMKGLRSDLQSNIAKLGHAAESGRGPAAGLAELDKARRLWAKAMEVMDETDSTAMSGVDPKMPGEWVVQKLFKAAPSDLKKALTRLRATHPDTEKSVRQALLGRHLDSAYDPVSGELVPKKLLELQHRQQDALGAIVGTEHQQMLDDFFAASRDALPGKPPRPTALDIVYRRYADLPDDVVAKQLVAEKSAGRIKRVLAEVEKFDPEAAAPVRRAVAEELFAASTTTQKEAAAINAAANDKDTLKRLTAIMSDDKQRANFLQVMDLARRMGGDRYAGSVTEPLQRMNELLQGVYKNAKTLNFPGLAMTWLARQTPKDLSVLMTHLDGPKSILTLTSPTVTQAQAVHALERLTAIVGKKSLSPNIDDPKEANKRANPEGRQ